MFWDPDDDDVALREAARIGALRGHASRTDYILCRTTTELTHVYKTRKPFLEAVQDELSAREPLEAESLLRRLPLSENQSAQLHAVLTPELRALVDREGVDHVYPVGSSSFRETESGWFDTRTGRQLVNGVIRVTELAGPGIQPERVRGKGDPLGKGLVVRADRGTDEDLRIAVLPSGHPQNSKVVKTSHTPGRGQKMVGRQLSRQFTSDGRGTETSRLGL